MVGERVMENLSTQFDHVGRNHNFSNLSDDHIGWNEMKINLRSFSFIFPTLVNLFYCHSLKNVKISEEERGEGKWGTFSGIEEKYHFECS